MSIVDTKLLMQPVVFDNIVSHIALVINTPLSSVSSGDYKRFLYTPLYLSITSSAFIPFMMRPLTFQHSPETFR